MTDYQALPRSNRIARSEALTALRSKPSTAHALPDAPVGTGAGVAGQPTAHSNGPVEQNGAVPDDVTSWRGLTRADSGGYTRSSGALAVGPQAVMGAVNGKVRGWRKSGTPLTDPTDLTEIFQPFVDLVASSAGVDLEVVAPRADYSSAHRRFVVAAEAQPQGEGIEVPVVFLAVSRQDSPTGPFCVVPIRFTTTDDPADTIGIADYSIAVNHHSIAVAANLYLRKPDGRAEVYASRIHLEKLMPLVRCEPATRDGALFGAYNAADATRFDSLIAANTFGDGDAAVFVGSHYPDGSRLQTFLAGWRSDDSFIGIAAGDVLDVDPYESPPDVPQKGSDVLVATGVSDVRGAAFAGLDALWTVQSVDHDGVAAALWHRLSLDEGVRAAAVTWLSGDIHLFSPQILPSLDCDSAVIAYNFSSARHFVSAGALRLGAADTVILADGTSCSSFPNDDPTPWDPRVPVVYDALGSAIWFQPSVADGASSSCTNNGWTTRVVRANWDLCDALGPMPTPTSAPGGTKGIGFALACKRVLRGVFGGNGILPRRGGMAGAANTGIQVQNVDGRLTAQPRATFTEQFLPYDPPVRERFTGQVEMRTIPPGASLNLYLPSLDLADAMYGVTIVTPRDGGDLSAILRTDWDSGAAAIVSNLRYTSRTVIPHVTRGFRGHTTVISVDNGEADLTDVVMHFYRVGSSAEVASKRFTLEPSAAQTFDLRDADTVLGSLGEGFLGSAVIEAPTGRVGAQVYEYVESSSLAVGGFEGVPASDASSRLFVPLFRSVQSGPGGIRLNTAIAVANAGARDASVTVTYRPTTNASASDACRAIGVVRHGPIRVPPNASTVFDQGPGGGHGLPENCFGTAVVEAASPTDRIVATVLDVQNDDETLSMIDASPAEFAGTKIALPLFRSRHLVAGFTTGIQVMNTSDQVATVHIDFVRSEGTETFPIGGCRGQCDAVVRPYEGYTWWPPAVQAVPPGTYGSAVISSDQPVVVLVNDYPLNGANDMATYAGIPVIVQGP